MTDGEWWKGVAIPEGSKPKEMGWGEYLDSIGRKVASGVSLGWADEAAAGMDALTQPVLGRGSDAPSMGERYTQNLGKEQTRDKAFEAEYPAASLTAEIGGNVAGALALPAKMFQAATVPAQMLKGAGSGAAIGGVAGAGASDPGKRVEGAIGGAELGGAVGGLAPAAIWAGQKVAGQALDFVGLRNADKGAVQQLLRAFERDGVDPNEALKRYQAWQQAGAKPEVLADLGGENVRNLAALTANTPGTARQAAMDLVEQRKLGAPGRVGDDVAKSISQNKDYSGTVDELMLARQREAQPLYDKAFEATAWSPRLNEFIADPIMKDGLKRGMNMLRLEAVAEGKPFNPSALGVDFNEAGDVIFKTVPNMRVLDAAKRGLDDILEKYRDGTTGRLNLTPEGRAIDGFRRSYLNVLDDLNPDYKTARAAWAGPTQSREAMELGRSILRDDADITAKKIAAMDPGDKEFFRAGVAKAIQDKVENTTDGRDVIRSFFSKPSWRNKLEAAFDDPAEFQRFKTAMEREAEMASVNNTINPRGGSQTFRLGAASDDAKIDPIGAFEQALQGNFRTALGKAIPSTRSNQGMDSSTADALSPLLFETDPAKVQATLQRLGNSAPQYPAISDARAALARALLGPVPAMQAGDTAAPRRPLTIDIRPSDARR